MTDKPEPILLSDLVDSNDLDDITPDVERWGPWRLCLEYQVLEHTETGYEVSLMECRTSAQCLDWIAQIAGKGWADPPTVAGLVHALDDVLHLQSSLCSFGQPSELTADQVRARAAEAVSWGPSWEHTHHNGDDTKETNR